jgi:hypothetical protein
MRDRDTDSVRASQREAAAVVERQRASECVREWCVIYHLRFPRVAYAFAVSPTAAVSAVGFDPEFGSISVYPVSAIGAYFLTGSSGLTSREDEPLA